MIKAIILDVDDTLLNFSKYAVKEILEIIKLLNLKPVEIEKINKLWGITIQKIVEKIWGKKHTKKFKREFIRLQKDKRFPPNPHALQLVRKLKKQYKIGAVTSKPKELARIHLKKAGFDLKNFYFINAAEDTKYNKPDPRVFSKPIKKLKLKPKEIIYIGDSIFDYIAAKKAGLNFIAVTTGSYAKKDFEKKGLKKQFILPSLRGVEKCLNAYFVK